MTSREAVSRIECSPSRLNVCQAFSTLIAIEASQIETDLWTARHSCALVALPQAAMVWYGVACPRPDASFWQRVRA